jgi:hypothetical protein
MVVEQLPEKVKTIAEAKRISELGVAVQRAFQAGDL